MPIDLTNINSNTATSVTGKKYSPKFFAEQLTGRGGKYGYLSEKNDPLAKNIENITTQQNHYNMPNKHSYHHGYTKNIRIPVNPLNFDAWLLMEELEVPPLDTMLYLGSHNQSNGKLYLKMEATALNIEETYIPGSYTVPATTTKKIIPAYQMQFFYVPDLITGSAPLMAKQLTNSYTTFHNKAYFWLVYTSNPLKDWDETIANDLAYNFNIKRDVFLNYLQNYSLYDSVEKSAELWHTEIHNILDSFFANIKKHYYQVFQKATTCHIYRKHTYNIVHVQNVVYGQMKYLISYNIPLENYKHIYQSLQKYFTQIETNRICKQNLNLLLTDTLDNLNANKKQLNGIKTPPIHPVPNSIKKLSSEQYKAVTSSEPLILTQAGAGTGKSTIILARIDYLIACGIDPKDITVLSFTNAAADHITDKNPNINSMTIARMIHEIYSNNFNDHALSTLNTILNSLEIYYPQEMQKPKSVERQFSNIILHMIRNDANNFTEMNNFIEENYDDVIRILDTIHQTSLELEIIICYQKITTFKEPDNISSKYLIIDEVQDNSVFEFIYTLKYVDKHKEALFIVGDCSQTLYEFRASNPRALNILESSGTFATYQLNINYRSNQEILDFANVLLGNIEANQYANIQLRANSRAVVTEQSFLQKVHFNYYPVSAIGKLYEEMPSIMHREVKPYIDDCLSKNETITFLAFTRRDIMKIEQILKDMYPNLKEDEILNIVPKRQTPVNVLTNFIKYHWAQVKYLPTNNTLNMITNLIQSSLNNITNQNLITCTNNMFNSWKTQAQPIIAAWENQVNNGQMTVEEFFNLIKENMIQYEVRTNGIQQSITSANNQEIKARNQNNAKFLLSTIHSAKGLEFDNVVILYRNENQMAEDKKRMYYVAFTRAMKSEYILAYDTMVSPQIQADYLTILENLHQKAPAPNSPFNRVDNNPLRL